jgi:hypothetical protein
MSHPSVVIVVSVTVSAYFAPHGGSVAPNPATDLDIAKPSIEAPHDGDAFIKAQPMPPATGQRHVPRISQPTASTPN